MHEFFRKLRQFEQLSADRLRNFVQLAKIECRFLLRLDN
jgi:hypothetical protein